MPKVNFKVPFLDPHGDPVNEPKRDFTKMKRNRETGQFEAEIVVDGEGYAVMEPTMLDDVVIDILMGHYEGDYALSGAERLKRHDLAQKVKVAPMASETSEGIDYTHEELELIRGLAAKSRPTAVLGELTRAFNASSLN